MTISRPWSLFSLHAVVILLVGTVCSQGYTQLKGKLPQKDAVAASHIEDRKYTFKDTDKELDYSVFVSSKYKKDTKAPLIIALHGLYSTPGQIIRYPGLTLLAEKYGYIVAAPMGYTTSGWYGGKGLPNAKGVTADVSAYSEKDVMNVLDMMRKEYRIDENRIYLMGHSMGGGGTLHLGIKYPEIWAALAPIAPAYFGPMSGLEKIKKVPVIIVQGDADNLVPVTTTRKWVDKMKELKMTYEYDEIPGGGHIDAAFTGIPKVFDFFEKHKKGEAKGETMP